MNYDNIICIQCNEKLKNFKNIIIHFIMHKNLCPFCVASYKSHKQFYDANGHFNNKKCKSFQSLIITNKEKRDSFYKKLKDITENNQNNQTNDNEENETIGLQYSDDENIEIESAQNEPAINIDNEQNKLNEIEIEFLMLGIDNSMSLILLQKIKNFWDKNINNLNQIRYTPQYLDKLFLNNFKIKGQFFKNENYDHSIFYFEIKNVLVNLLNKNHFFERIDFDTDFENGIYTNFKSGEQFKRLKKKKINKIVLLRIFSDSMQCNNKKDYTIMVEIENYIGDEFKKINYYYLALFSTLLCNGFNLQIGNEQIDVVPFGLTMDIPEFRTSCKLNGHNSNEYACHTCDKSRDGLFICQSGTLRKQEDITNFHSTKPKYDELYNDIELKQVWEKKKKK
ncbi:hypothetical protein ACTFIW_003662 [Dictyostelium discoideum]